MSKYSLPTSTTVNGHTYTITENGDFRMVLDCFSALGDEILGEDYRVLACLLIFYNELNSIEDIANIKEDSVELVKWMYKFFNCGSDDAPGAVTKHNYIDWDKDVQIISAAVNKVANTEIRSMEYVHWWTFMGYFMSIGNSVLSTVVSIRSKLLENKKLEKWEKDFKRENPNYFIWKSGTVEDREVENLIRDLWNNNSGGDK